MGHEDRRKLADLEDCEISSPAEGQVVAWEAATSKFKNKAPEGGTAPAGTLPPAMQLSLARFYPFGGTATTLTSTNHGALTARVFPFHVTEPITVTAIYVKSNAVLANCLRVAIFDADGAQVWQSSVLSTVAAGWVIITGGGTPSFPITLQPGTYYWATTNNGVVSTTAAFHTCPSPYTAVLPRWGTVPTTGGAMPASINPAAITETIGGWMIYVLLSAVTT